MEIRIDKRNKAANDLLEIIKSMPFSKIWSKVPNDTTLRAMREADLGKDKPVTLDELLKR